MEHAHPDGQPHGDLVELAGAHLVGELQRPLLHWP